MPRVLVKARLGQYDIERLCSPASIGPHSSHGDVGVSLVLFPLFLE
jgi:hypothetical protein